jgi:hypothetical protein
LPATNFLLVGSKHKDDESTTTNRRQNMNTTHKIAGAFAAVLAVIALGGTLQAAVADSTRVNPTVTARALAHGVDPSAMLQRSANGERTRTTTVAG